MSNFLPRNQASRLLWGAFHDRDLVIEHGPCAGIRFNSGKYNYQTSLGTYELPVQTEIANNLDEGDVFYDIGANVGFFSCLAARRVGERGKVFAFEPEPRNAAQLRRNIEMNGLAQVTVIQKAVCSASGRGRLLLASYCGTHSMAQFRTPTVGAGEIAVDTVRIDDLIDSGHLTPPTLVKIDVEGAECDVIQGMVRTIDIYRPRIIYETDAERREDAMEKEREIHEFLSARNYEIRRLEDSYGDYFSLENISHYVGHFLARPQ
jgi:FkbM family methyltransferase